MAYHPLKASYYSWMCLSFIIQKRSHMNMIIYKRIRGLREDSDLSQQFIADFLHVSQRAYSRYENGERSIPIETLCTLADFYHVSVDYLLERTDRKSPYPSK